MKMEIDVKKVNKILFFLVFLVLVINQLELKDVSAGGIDSKNVDGKTVFDVLIPRGIPDVYGDELGISFENPVEAIAVMRQMDPTYGQSKLVMEGTELERYVKIGSMIACEFCCGAKTLVFSDGRAACGCAHSWAMRGLSAYLINNHRDEFTDEEILRELAKWKVLYFPKQMSQKFIVQINSEQFTPDIESLVKVIADKDLKEVQKNSEEMYEELKNLPGMVGGC
jgi:hypothetical protein